MTPTEIGQQLPNGFHGARIGRIATDYVRRVAELSLAVPVPDTAGAESRLRGCKLTIMGLAYLSLDVPDPNYDYLASIPIETGSLLDTTPQLLPSLPALQEELGSRYFCNSFFVEEWNGFIHFSGSGCEFAWTED